MNICRLNLLAALIVCSLCAVCQTTYLPLNQDEYHLLDRLEIKQTFNTSINYSTIKPYSRKSVVEECLFLDSARMGYADSTGSDKYPYLKNLNLSHVDEANLQSLYLNNSEWLPEGNTEFNSKRPFLKTFYKTKANLLEVRNKDFFLAVNPVLQLQFGKETDNNELIFLNSRGVSIRGRIANKIGFASTITDNQERGPSYFQQQVMQLRAVPGNGFYKGFKVTGYDYFDARGYVTFNATKYINFQIGYDKNFIGNGYRSLFLSDWGNSYLFVKLNTKIWKFNYENIFMELMPQFTKNGDSLLPRKYAAMHHLSMDVTRWLNVGLFEGVIFGRKDHFDFQYMNPIIFYRHIEGTVGSPDNAVAGLDFKANIAHHFQLYGQLLLDEFILSEIKNNPTSWVNKFGIQLGAKYIDAFGINNLDLQLEVNRVRPFTYSHNDTIANYTHYNQPLAHPLGANFQEVIGIVNYQPLPKWNFQAKLFYYYKGLDSSGKNYGGNIFEDYRTRVSENGFKIGSGDKYTCLNAMINISYKLRENLFIDAGLQQRTFKTSSIPVQRSTFVSGGIRLNISKRNYDY